MRVGSLFSGIGGFDRAAERCGMTVAWQVEVDRFARRVLKHHWPGVEQHGDIRAIDPGQLGAVDLLCGGWPCQGNSVAGKRGGHGDERSGLFSQILRLVDGMAPRPAFLVLENVPGLVSVNERRDFAGVIGELRRRGYVGCVRVLDAQYFGLAQRRKRLLFVAGLGAAGLRAVQLVLEGGVRHPAPRRQAGESVAASLTRGSSNGGVSYPGRRREDDVNLVTSPAERAKSNDPQREDMAAYVVFGGNRQAGPLDVATACNAKGGTGRMDFESETFISHTLRADGFDASEDGAGRGTPLVMMTGQPNQNGLGVTEDLTYTLDQSNRQAVAFDPTQITSPGNYSHPRAGDPCHPLASSAHPPAVAFCASEQMRSFATEAETAYTLQGHPQSEGSNVQYGVRQGASVRRLTPTECERLMGFPDGFTCLCGAADEYRQVLRMVWELACEEELSERASRELLSLATQTVLRLHLRQAPSGASRGLPTDFWAAAGAAALSDSREALRGVRHDRDADRPSPSKRRHPGQRDGQCGVPVRPVPHERALEAGELCGPSGGAEHPAPRLPWQDCQLEGMSIGICRCPDGPRYRALGNAIAVPVAEWVLRRVRDALS